jgi:hypothetical protein
MTNNFVYGRPGLQSSWGDVDVELWLLHVYVSDPDSPFLTEWDKNEHGDFSSDSLSATLFKFFFEVIGDLGPE